VADEWVTQLLRQGDAKVFKKYSQMKLQMKREALKKMNRKANDGQAGLTETVLMRFCHGLPQSEIFFSIWAGRTVSEIQEVV
jgi:hypothetical protein